ncbi:MAG: GGDEF domain-containing protein [Candidatus Promineifilaceae bacterium]
MFLTERRERQDRLAGLKLGAVDYVTKPFDVQELRLRVQNVILRIESETHFNPITRMPDGFLLRNEIESMLNAKNWGLVTAGVHGIENFRNRYGFIAADDVTRSISLILAQVCNEELTTQPFVGQLGPAEFAIITTADCVEKLAKQCQSWIEPAIPWFYPMQIRESLAELPESERLSPAVSQLSSTQGITSYNKLHNYLVAHW